MFWQTSREARQLTLRGCSVLHIAARLNLFGTRIEYPAWRHS